MQAGMSSPAFSPDKSSTVQCGLEKKLHKHIRLQINCQESIRKLNNQQKKKTLVRPTEHKLL